MGKFSRDASIAILGVAIGGIVVAAITFYFLKVAPDLSFVRFPATSYHDTTKALTIYSVNLENSGNREAEAIDVEAGLIGQARFVGFSYDKSMDLIDITASKTDARSQRFHIRELNPGQYVTFSFLAENSLGQQVRFEAATSGQVAHESSANDREQGLWFAAFWYCAGIFAAAISAIFWFWFKYSSSKLQSVAMGLSGLRVRMAKADDQIQATGDLLNFLLETPLELIYNPSKANASKDISFLRDGTVGKGKNLNESMWRISNGVLEILNAGGSTHNRFCFDPKQRILVSTNDPDTVAVQRDRIQNQWIREAAV